MGGKTRSEPTMWWSGFGFSSQGDGACFEGRYDGVPDPEFAIKTHAPEDATLRQIASALAALRQFRLTAVVTHSDRYYHSRSADIAVYGEDGNGVDSPAADDLREALRRFMDWIYAQLRQEYDYRMSDEFIDETILANDYTFTVEGKRFG
mgnify:CR=1 FL=1